MAAMKKIKIYELKAIKASDDRAKRGQVGILKSASGFAFHQQRAAIFDLIKCSSWGIQLGRFSRSSQLVSLRAASTSIKFPSNRASTHEISSSTSIPEEQPVEDFSQCRKLNLTAASREREKPKPIETNRDLIDLF
jgi:hypothetical protein